LIVDLGFEALTSIARILSVVRQAFFPPG